MPQITPTAFTLYDLSGNLASDNEFRDAEARSAYYCQIVNHNPLSTKITRLTDWPRQPLAPIPEPWTSWLFFTSNEAMEGYIKFGSGEPLPMGGHLSKRHPMSQSRWFTGLDGRRYKWKPASRSLHCYDSNDTLLAVYEYCVEDDFFAKLDIKKGAENMLTEIVTTLLLNRHAIRRSP